MHPYNLARFCQKKCIEHCTVQKQSTTAKLPLGFPAGLFFLGCLLVVLQFSFPLCRFLALPTALF